MACVLPSLRCHRKSLLILELPVKRLTCILLTTLRLALTTHHTWPCMCLTEACEQRPGARHMSALKQGRTQRFQLTSCICESTACGRADNALRILPHVVFYDKRVLTCMRWMSKNGLGDRGVHGMPQS